MEKSKKESKQKDGVKYLIDQGYKKLSAKTFISDIELEHFLNKEFSNINKTRALGFIQILQREYDVDLSELKKAYLEHENSLKKREPETLFVETPMKSDKQWKKYIPHIVATILFIGVLFLLWENSKKSSIQPLQTTDIEGEKEVKIAQKNIENLEKIEKVEEEKESNSKEAKETIVVEESLDIDEDLEKIVLQMIKERNITTENIQVQKQENLKDINQTEAVNITKTAVKTQEQDINKSKKEEIKPQLSKKEVTPMKPKSVTKGKLYIVPTQKAWVGVIYLDDFSKKDFLIRSRLPLDASRDQLIVVGHKHFRIYNKTYSVKFMGKGPVRFIYKDGELMEISKEEFVKTSAGVIW